MMNSFVKVAVLIGTFGCLTAASAASTEGTFAGCLPKKSTLLAKGCRPEQIELTGGVAAGSCMKRGELLTFCCRREYRDRTTVQAQVAEGTSVKGFTIVLQAISNDVYVSAVNARYATFAKPADARAALGKIDFTLSQATRSLWKTFNTFAVAENDKATGYNLRDLAYRVRPASAVRRPQQAWPTLTVKPDREPAVYACGETATLTLSVKSAQEGGRFKGKMAVELSDFELDTVPEIVWVSFADKPVVTIRRTLKKPGFLKMRIEDGLCGWTDPWTVGFSPEKIKKGSPLPKDFAAWWKSELARAAKEVPLDPQMTLVPERSKPAFNMYRISFATFGRRVYGTLSIPTKPGKHRLNVQIASAGFADFANFGGSSPNAAMLWFSVFPFKPDWEWRKLNIQADYDAMNREHGRKWGTGWPAVGLGGKRTDYFFHPVIIAASRAVDWLAARDDINEKDIVYNGGSQGGGLGMMLVGINGHFRKAVFGVPALTDTMGWLAGHKSGWPTAYESRRKNPDDGANYIANMPYFDAANFCTLIRCPVLINLGMRDTIVPPTAIAVAFNCLKSEDKTLEYEFDAGHGMPDRVYFRRAQWLAK